MSEIEPAGTKTGDVCEKFLTLSVVAAALGVPVFTLRRAIKRGHLPAYQLGGRARVRLSELVNAIEQQRDEL